MADDFSGVEAHLVHVGAISVRTLALPQEVLAILGPTEGRSQQAIVSHRLVHSENGNGGLVWLVVGDVGREGLALL